MNLGRAFCTILPGICNSRRGSYNVRNYWILFVNLNNYTFPIKMLRLDISDPADILLSRHHSILLFSRRHHLNGVCSFDFHLRVYAICSRILYSYVELREKRLYRKSAERPPLKSGSRLPIATKARAYASS